MKSVGKHSQAACGGVSHRLHRFTRILGTEEKDTNHTDVAQEIFVTIRGICGKHSQAACGGASHKLRRFTRILGAEEKDTNHTDVAQEKICDNP